MDFEVHRLRIGNWKPDAIKTVACDDQFSHNLAIGKENGEIEIVDPVDNFALLLRVTGRDDFRLQALAWSKFISEHGRNRLFGISLKGFLFEVDLNEGKIVHVTDCFSSAVWAIQSSPRSDILAVGCEDGAVRLFEFGHHRRAPDYFKSLTTAGARVLCLAYHQTLPKLVIGSADGVIRVLDETSGRVLQRLSATTPVGQTCCIWSLALLKDETIVTGDSNGRVLVWDGQRGVATHCFTQHSADVLALVASRDETQLFAAGVDGKVVCLRRGASSSQSSSSSSHSLSNTWQYTHSQRSHTHDVFCLALCATATHQRQLPAYHRKRKRTVGDLGILGSTQSLGEAGVLGQYSGYHSGDCLVSGGLDAKLCVYAVQDFARLRPLYLPFLPQGQDAVQHDDLYRVVALTQGRHIDLWLTNLQFLSQNSSSSGSPEYALRVSVKGPEHVSCVALSPCGQLLVCATPPSSTSSNYSLHVWQLLQTDTSLSVKQRVSLPATLSVGHVTALRFLPARDTAATHCQLAVFDGQTQRLYIVQFNKQQQSFVDSEVVASIDCNLNLHNDNQLHNNSSNGVSGHTATRSLAGATPRRLQVSSCGKFIAFTSATRYLENHLPGVPGHSVVNNANNSETALHVTANSATATHTPSAGTATQVETQQSLRIVSSHTVTVVDVSRKSVCHRVKALPSAVVDLTFATHLQDTTSSMLLILLQNGSLKCFETTSFRPLSLPCSSLAGHSPTTDVRLPHRLRFPLQHIATQHSVSPVKGADNNNNKHKLFLYGQMQSVFVDVTQAQPETPRVVQPTYLMTQTQLAHQQALTHELLTKAKNANNSEDDTAATHHPRVSVLHASVPIGSGYNGNNSSDVNNNGTNNEEEESRDTLTNAQNKKRKVQFVGGKDKDTAVAAGSGDTVQDTLPGSSNNCALVDVYRNILHMGFLCVPDVSHTSTATVVSSAKKSSKKSETVSESPASASRQILILVENPWARIAESLPDTVSRKRYGT